MSMCQSDSEWAEETETARENTTKKFMNTEMAEADGRGEAEGGRKGGREGGEIRHFARGPT